MGGLHGRINFSPFGDDIFLNSIFQVLKSHYLGKKSFTIPDRAFLDTEKCKNKPERIFSFHLSFFKKYHF